MYARIDGFLSTDGKVFLNDPNTTSGMMPSSFFFHQAAEIGLTPSQFLTYIIRTSLSKRIKSSKGASIYEPLLEKLDTFLLNEKDAVHSKIPVAVVLGGYSSERHNRFVNSTFLSLKWIASNHRQNYVLKRLY